MYPLLIGGGILMKMLGDKINASDTAAATASDQKWSGWSKSGVRSPAGFNPAQSIGAGIGAGASFGQSLDAAESQKLLQQAQINWLNGNGAAKHDSIGGDGTGGSMNLTPLDQLDAPLSPKNKSPWDFLGYGR